VKVALHNKLRNAQELEASTVVIYDKYDNPIAIAVEPMDGVIIAATADHPEFRELLHQLGIHSTAIVKEINVRAPTFAG
jgi:hypothetical protein